MQLLQKFFWNTQQKLGPGRQLSRTTPTIQKCSRHPRKFRSNEWGFPIEVSGIWDPFDSTPFGFFWEWNSANFPQHCPHFGTNALIGNRLRISLVNAILRIMLLWVGLISWTKVYEKMSPPSEASTSLGGPLGWRAPSLWMVNFWWLGWLVSH